MFLFSPPHRQRGSFLVLSAVILPLFLLVAGVCVDIGAMYLAKSNQQNAADAAALAGAQELPDADKATAMARDYLVRNGFSRAIADAANVEILESNTKCRVTFDAPAKLVVFGGLFDTGPTIRARAAAIGSQGGGYAIFAGSGTSWDNQHALYIANNNTKISGNIHSNNGIGVSGSFNLAPGEITCMTGHRYGDTYSGSPALKHVAEQPFPDRSDEIAAYKNSVRCFKGSDTAAFIQALQAGTVDGIYAPGPLALSFNAGNAAAAKNLQFLIAEGKIDVAATSSLASSAHPLLIASFASFPSPQDAVTFQCNTTSNTYVDLYAPNAGVNLQGNNVHLFGSIAGKSVTLQLNSLSVSATSGVGGRILRLVE